MDTVINITAPIFFLIFIGFLAVRLGFISKDAIPGLSRFVLYLALPALVFGNILSMDFGQIINMSYMLVYAAGGICAFVVATLVTRYAFSDSWQQAGVRGLGAALPNSAFVGFPILQQYFSDPPAQAFAMAVMVENILLMPLVLIFLESVSGQHQGNQSRLVKTVLSRVIKNPIIVAVLLGLGGSLLGIHLPKFITTGLEILAKGSAAVALIVIGGALVGVSIRGSLGQMGCVAVAKLLVFPLVVFALLQWIPGIPSDLKMCVLLFAAMPMFSIYPIIGGQYGQQSFCASTLLITTVAAFFSVSVLLALL